MKPFTSPADEDCLPNHCLGLAGRRIGCGAPHLEVPSWQQSVTWPAPPASPSPRFHGCSTTTPWSTATRPSASWQVAASLDYWPNSAAQSLTTSRTRTFGVLLPDLFGEFYSEVIRGIDQPGAPQRLPDPALQFPFQQRRRAGRQPGHARPHRRSDHDGPGRGIHRHRGARAAPDPGGAAQPAHPCGPLPLVGDRQLRRRPWRRWSTCFHWAIAKSP